LANGDLTPKQRRFIEAYVGEAKGNGSLAVRLAGYKCKSERSQRTVAAQNLAKRNIAEEIEKHAKRETARAIISREEVMALLAEIALNRKYDVSFYCRTCCEYVDTEDETCPQCEGKCREIIKPREKTQDRVKAMDVLNKMRGEYIQRHEVSVRNMTEKDRKERVKVLLAQVVEHDS